MNTEKIIDFLEFNPETMMVTPPSKRTLKKGDQKIPYTSTEGYFCEDGKTRQKLCLIMPKRTYAFGFSKIIHFHKMQILKIWKVILCLLICLNPRIQ